MSTPVNGFPIGPHRVLHRSPQGHQEVKEQVKGIKVNNRGGLIRPLECSWKDFAFSPPIKYHLGAK